MTQKPERFSPRLLFRIHLKEGNAVPGAAEGSERVQTNRRLQGMKAVEVLRQEGERFLFSSTLSLP